MKSRWYRWWWLWLVLIATVLCLATPWPSQWLAAPLSVNEAPRKSDVIIILGAGTRHGPDPMPQQAKQRVAAGVDLWQHKWAERVIVSGGVSPKTGKTEAILMKQFATSVGAPAENVLQELESRNTYENIVNSQQVMKQHDWQTALLVTTSYHTWRACRIAHQLEVDVRCIAAPLTEGPSNRFYERMVNLRSVVREYGAILYFLIRGYV